MCVEKWYPVLCRVRDNRVLAEWVIDCRQDYGWLITDSGE